MTQHNELSSAWHLLRTTLEEWNADNATHLAAALAYYTIFSLAPLLIIAIAIAGLLFGREAAQGQLVGQIEAYINDGQTAEFIQSMLKNASTPATNILATMVGVAVLLFGATGVFGELKNSLNLIWDAPARPSSIRNLIIQRILTLAMVLVSGFLLLASLIVSTVLVAAKDWVEVIWPGMGAFGLAANFLFFFLVTVLLFALVYKYVPDMNIAWRDVWIGAAATAVLFSAGRYLISLYLSHSTVQSTYGAAGSLAVLLLWVYYSAQIFFLGAEFTQVYARTEGSRRHEHPLLLEEESAPEVLVDKAVEPASTTAIRPARPKQTWRRSVTRPLFALVTAVGILAALSVINIVREPFRK
jgi:membrane protein